MCCFRFLVNNDQDFENRKWAAEGMAFLTLDAEVKEDLVKDKKALEALFELAKVRASLDCCLSVEVLQNNLHYK